MKTKMQGFTLIEMLIVVALAGILAKIAIPTYQDSIQKSKRVQAQAALLSLANAMETYRVQNSNSYAGATIGTGGIFANQVPVDGSGTKIYTLDIGTPTASTYTLSATPVKTDSLCGTLSLANTGVKTPTTAGCW